MQETSPLDALERAVLSTRANREELEDTLQSLPRWRFRRRRDVERSLNRRRSREEQLLQELNESSTTAPQSLTG
jgi:GH24 family phage-related lysozyme (muramidase)